MGWIIKKKMILKNNFYCVNGVGYYRVNYYINLILILIASILIYINIIIFNIYVICSYNDNLFNYIIKELS